MSRRTLLFTFVMLHVITIPVFVLCDALILFIGEDCGLCRVAVDLSCHMFLCGVSWVCSLLVAGGVRQILGNPVKPTLSGGQDVSFRCTLKREVLMSVVCGGVLDIDHFLASRKFSYFAATHLTTRPFGHAVGFPLLCGLLVFLVFRNLRGSLLVASSLMVHLLRDGIRRGLWFWPFGSTPRLSLYVFIAALFVGSILNGCFLAQMGHEDVSMGIYDTFRVQIV